MSAKRTLTVHGALAVAALLLALMAWRHSQQAETAGGEEEEEEFVVADISKANLKAIAYRSPDRQVDIELAPEAGGTSWVTVTTKTKLPPRPRHPAKQPPEHPSVDGGVADGGPVVAGDGGTPAPDGGTASDAGVSEADGGAPEPEADYREETVRFAANENLDELLSKLAPLKAVRRLGKLSPEQLSEFELNDPQGSLELKLSDGSRRFEIGARTFGAGSYYYIRDPASGEAYLLSSKSIRDLDMAQSRLMQRDLHRFEPSEEASAVVTAGSRRLELTQRNRHNPQERVWVQTSTPDSASTAITNWMRQVERLRALAYPSDDDAFTGEGQTPIVRIEYKNEQGGSLGFVELVRTGATPPEFLGRSEATGSWVRLSQTLVEQLENDLDGIFGE